MTDRRESLLTVKDKPFRAFLLENLPAETPDHLIPLTEQSFLQMKMVSHEKGMPKKLNQAIKALSDDDMFTFMRYGMFPLILADDGWSVREAAFDLHVRQFSDGQVAELTSFLHSVPRNPSGSLGAREHWLTMVEVGLLQAPFFRKDASISTLGSISRSFGWFSGLHPQGAEEDLLAAFAASKNTPVEVLGRMFSDIGNTFWSVDETWLDQHRNLLHKVRARSKKQYPDLAGLPDDLWISLMASQPIPDGWFQDAWEIPADGYVDQRLGFPFWVEVIERKFT